MKILGIDPGLRNTGFGLIEIVDKEPQYIASGVITTKNASLLALRIKDIVTGINEVITTYTPEIVAIEKVFVNVNPKTTLLLGQARGAALAGAVMHNLPLFEYTALQVKQAVVGYGHAEKEQIMRMVKYSLKLGANPQKDAADALAVALTHFYSQHVWQKFNVSNKKNRRIME